MGYSLGSANVPHTTPLLGSRWRSITYLARRYSRRGIGARCSHSSSERPCTPPLFYSTDPSVPRIEIHVHPDLLILIRCSLSQVSCALTAALRLRVPSTDPTSLVRSAHRDTDLLILIHCPLFPVSLPGNNYRSGHLNIPPAHLFAIPGCIFTPPMTGEARRVAAGNCWPRADVLCYGA